MTHYKCPFFGTWPEAFIQVKLVLSAFGVTVLLSSCSLAPVSLSGNGKWGFVNKEGDVVISPQFDEVVEDLHGGDNYLGRRFRNFSEGLAAVKLNGKWGYIDKSGAVVVKPQFDMAGPFSEGLACVGLARKYGYIDKSGNIVIPLKFDCTAVQNLDGMEFSDGLARAVVQNRLGYMDHTGKVVIPCRFIDADPFSEGIARVRLMEDVIETAKERRRDSYIDKTGKVLFKCFAGDMRCSEGTVVVSDGTGKSFFVDKAGKKIFTKSFYSAQRFSDGLAAVATSLRHNDPMWGPEYGYIDKSGAVVIAPRFKIPGNWGHNFVEGRAMAALPGPSGGGSINARCGIIDRRGKWIVRPTYNFIAAYRDGLALFHSTDGQSCGFLDRDGKVAIQAKFPKANSFSEGLAAVWVR